MDNLSPAARATLEALAQLGEGTVEQLREQTGKAKSTTDKALRELAEAGFAVAVEDGDGPTRWRPAQPDTADAAPEPPATADAGAEGTAVAADESARPRPADRKVLIVAGVLGDYPDGATVDVIADACGLGIASVARILAAMEAADAARRIPADPDTSTPERWVPGEGKASDVDPNPPAPRCPTCGQVIRPARTSPAAAGRAGVNGDGAEPLGRNVLRGAVLEFINAHPGHVFTPQTIADELGARLGRVISSGAVRNNCTTLAAAGAIQLATETPLAFTATSSPAETDGQS
jgi:DNA-binding transcriptional ArsR family regulator